MRKLYIAIALISLYIASPYYAVYSLINCLNDGDTIALKKVVDFPALRESLKDEMKSKLVQQTKRSISSKEEEFADKLVSGMGAMFGPAIIDGLVDTFVTPSGLAGLIANPSSALNGAKARNENKIPNISWAFFTGLTDFQAKITEKQETLTLHFRLKNFRWMLYAITWKNMQNSSDVQISDPIKLENPVVSNKITPIGIWKNDKGLIIDLTENGQKDRASYENHYEIDSNGMLTVKSWGGKTTKFTIAQTENDSMTLTDSNNKIMKLNRINQSDSDYMIYIRKKHEIDSSRKMRARAEAEIAALSAALESYKADHGSYPIGTNIAPANTNQFLRAALAPSRGRIYFEFSEKMGTDLQNSQAVIDPYGEGYGYRYPGDETRSGTNFFDLWSRAGSEDTIKWIKNW
jgi:hypothetical protein